jgi:hypothetical protein
MNEQFVFGEKHEFLQKLKDLVKGGISPKKINVFTPYPVHEVEEILKVPTSPLRFFTLLGALSGLFFGAWFTAWTSLDWPLIGGGKPIVSVPAFVIVTFELTILFGGVISFLGFLILSKLPSPKRIGTPVEHGNQFVIEIQSEGK